MFNNQPSGGVEGVEALIYIICQFPWHTRSILSYQDEDLWRDLGGEVPSGLQHICRRASKLLGPHLFRASFTLPLCPSETISLVPVGIGMRD